MDALPTAVYIDGYNLYYGRLRGQPIFKWLDVVSLFDDLIQKQDPSSTITKVSLFSAPALSRFASNGQASMAAQESYHRALAECHPDRFTLTMGSHTWSKRGVWLPRFEPKIAYCRADKVCVWQIVEKRTDVNIALAMYRDARKGAYRQMVLCSNDSDAEPALRAIREDFPEIRLGVITPMPPSSGKPHRPVSGSLSAASDWIRGAIRDDELALHQLPARIPTKKKMIVRPSHW